jgi:hypothetical protein
MMPKLMKLATAVANGSIQGSNFPITERIIPAILKEGIVIMRYSAILAANFEDPAWLGELGCGVGLPCDCCCGDVGFGVGGALNGEYDC